MKNIRLVPSIEVQRTFENAINTKLTEEEVKSVIAFGSNLYREGLINGFLTAVGLFGVGVIVALVEMRFRDEEDEDE